MQTLLYIYRQGWVFDSERSQCLRFQSPVPLSLVVGIAFAVLLSDVPSALRFLVDIFFVVHAEFEVGVLSPEEFRWKIFLGEDLEPLVVLVCHLRGKLFVIHRW